MRVAGGARVWLVLPLAVYLLLPTRNYYWDGVSFAINIERGLPLRDVLSPSHLLYPVFGLALYKAALAVGLHARALFLMQFANGVAAAGAVVLVFRALRRRKVSLEAAVGGALLFAFAATWWKFATDANAYIPSILLVLCANDLLEERRSVWGAAAAHCGAMLCHQLALLFLPVALLRLKGVRQRLLYAGVALGVTGGVYAAAYVMVFGRFGPANFAAWLTTHSPDAGFSFGPVRDVALSARGTLRLFFGGKPGQAGWNALTVAAVACLAALAITLARRWRRGIFQFTRPPGDLALWTAIYAGFLFFWMPQNTFYRLFYLAPLVLLTAATVRRVPRDGAAPWIVCGLLFAWNLAFMIYPESRIENNVPLRFALAQTERWRPGTAIAFRDYNTDLWTITYFNPQVSWMWMGRLDLDGLERALEGARQRGEPLWLDPTAYEMVSADAGGRSWLAMHMVSGGTLDYRDPKHEFRFYQLR